MCGAVLCHRYTGPPLRGGGLCQEVSMTNPTGAQCASSHIEHLQAAFLQIMPRIQTHAEVYFRYLRCPGKRDDAIAEVVAVAWKWYLRLCEQGKDASEFVSTLATLA